jgi:hypothetical protein
MACESLDRSQQRIVRHDNLRFVVGSRLDTIRPRRTRIRRGAPSARLPEPPRVEP